MTENDNYKIIKEICVSEVHHITIPPLQFWLRIKTAFHTEHAVTSLLRDVLRTGCFVRRTDPAKIDKKII